MTEQQPTADSVDMTWVLNQLKEEKGVLHALLVSSDGLMLAASDGLPRELADRTAANVSGLFSLGRTVSEFAGTDAPTRKIIIDLPDSCILVFGAGHRTVLAVSVCTDMTSREVVVASAATIKAINGLQPALSARERTTYSRPA
ncbi:roadblock/LC7 domain-containing protein [Streptomyces sp. NPDC007083]|uniref:roadblock/LC7 domain-containing protein n=1 Tax=Streptomyces sp. NPDC007083 TaxID=3156913 RepID=UPI0033DC0C6D